MSNNKQTAVEWLIEIYLTTGIDRNVHFHQAKAMEKEQIIDTFQDSRILSITNNCNSGEQYYNQTYGGNK